MAGRLKVSTSPDVIAFVQRIGDTGVAIIKTDKKSFVLQGGAPIQGVSGVLICPATNGPLDL